MKFIKVTILFLVVCVVGCGVKANPQPPLTPEAQLQYDKEQKEKAEKRERQMKAIAERNKKIEEEKAAKEKNGN